MGDIDTHDLEGNVKFDAKFEDFQSQVPPSRKRFEDSRTFLWVGGIGVFLAALSTIVHAGDSGSLQPEENGGGLWGLVLYFLFAGLVWSFILGAILSITEGIYNSFTHRPNRDK